MADTQAPYWEKAFFEALAQSGKIKRSAAAAGVTTGAIYNRKASNAEFANRLTEVRAPFLGKAPSGRSVRGNRADSSATKHPPLQWQGAFLDALAETSNVSASAKRAGIAIRVVYDLRRGSPDFAAKWQRALYEGYTNLEMEVLGYLRAPGTKRKMDVTNALRLLAAHKDTVAKEEAQRANVNAADVRASIARKVEVLRQQVLAKRQKKNAE